MTNVEFFRDLSVNTLSQVIKAIDNERANLSFAFANDLIRIDSEDDYQYWMQIDLALADTKQTACIIRDQKRG